MSPWAESKTLSFLSASLLVFTTLILPGSTRSLGIRAEQCPIPNWHVDAINITYSNDTYIPGTASFTLSNTVTNKTEALSCPLTFNSLCQILGTPNDETLQVVMQVNIDAAYITLNQSWTCHDQLNQSTTYVLHTLMLRSRAANRDLARLLSLGPGL
jgi:hypothetical protein